MAEQQPIRTRQRLHAGSASVNSPDDQQNPRLTQRFVQAPIESIKAAKRRLRKHRKGQLETLIALIERYGYVPPLPVDGENQLIDGHLIWEALKRLGHKQIWITRIEHLNPTEILGLRLALHKIMDGSSFDEPEVKLVFEEIFQFDPSLATLTGFQLPEIDTLMLADLHPAANDDDIPQMQEKAVSRLGDIWHFSGGHRLGNLDAKHGPNYAKLLGDLQVQMMLTDVPYGIVPIKGVASSKHREFVEGSSLSEEQTAAFFKAFLDAAMPVIPPGCIVDAFIDFRAMSALTCAMRGAGLEHICTAVFDKQVGGLGGLYRHQAEFVLVMKKPGAKPINNIALGKFGRNRTTIWSVPGYASFGPGRAEALASHPTCKPPALLMDAILDTSHRGGVICDPFSGSGSTLVAAHRTARVGVGMDFDSLYVDVAVRRLQTVTGQAAVHAETGMTFDEMAARRLADPMLAQ